MAIYFFRHNVHLDGQFLVQNAIIELNIDCCSPAIGEIEAEGKALAEKYYLGVYGKSSEGNYPEVTIRGWPQKKKTKISFS